jgi:hypothetical protein
MTDLPQTLTFPVLLCPRAKGVWLAACAFTGLRAEGSSPNVALERLSAKLIKAMQDAHDKDGAFDYGMMPKDEKPNVARDWIACSMDVGAPGRKALSVQLVNTPKKKGPVLLGPDMEPLR